MSTNIGQEFILKTQYPHLSPSAHSEGVPMPPFELPYDPGQPLIDLPAPSDLVVDPVDLRELIERRTTVRRYTSQPLTLAELSYLLWCTQGVKSTSTPEVIRRTVPSAGSRHAFETFVLANRVKGLQPGLYRFLSLEHKLIPLNLSATIAERLMRACRNQMHVVRSAATFFWIAVPERMTWRYSERGYRYLLLDAGHVCQNLYLAALALGCGTCAVGAFSDEELNYELKLDGDSQWVIYAGTVGKRET
jgi:SagB-type dehydrogenase family enzyme